jgi:hypothetical protein
MKQRAKQNDEVVLQVYCLTADEVVLPEMMAKHPSWPLEKLLLLAGIEKMEATLRKQGR